MHGPEIWAMAPDGQCGCVQAGCGGPTSFKVTVSKAPRVITIATTAPENAQYRANYGELACQIPELLDLGKIFPGE